MPDDVQVLISYKRLTELLETAQGLEELKEQNKRILDLIEGLKINQIQCMDAIGELRKELR